MGVVTKFVLELPDLSVSNNVFLGEYILDADITIEMIYGALGSHFEIRLYDLPEKEVVRLRDRLDDDKSLPVRAKLGYFEGRFGKVLEGLATQIKAEVKDNQLVTTLKGLEAASHALIKNDVQAVIKKDTPFAEAVAKVLEKLQSSEGGTLDRDPKINGFTNVRLGPRSFDGKGMEVLDTLARERDAELLVNDGKVFIGKPVRRKDPPRRKPGQEPRQIVLVPDQNLARFEPFERKIPTAFTEFDLRPMEPSVARGFRFLMVGDPRLRPGQRLDASKVEGFDDEYRASSIKHRFEASGGYTCEGAALRVCRDNDEACRKRHTTNPRPDAGDVARWISQRARSSQRPFVEVAKVKEHVAGSAISETSGIERAHRTSLYHAAKADAAESQPSVDVAIADNDDRVFDDKPMVSPFAWHRCGLVVPVYPGMKAVVQHNLGLGDDALVAGFLWSKEPTFEPPPAETGDWWLCLPVSPPADGPQNDTPAVNDLTAADGRRVIETAGVRIVIGEGALGTVGERPELPEADTLHIEHVSGTVVNIDSDGKLTLTAAAGIEIEGDLTIRGNVAIE